MNFTVIIEAPELVGALNNLAAALGNSNPLDGVTIATDSKVHTKDKTIEAPKKDEPELEENSVAEKTLYFKHEGTDSAVIVKKGESLDFLNKDIFDEISKAEYTKIIAAQKQTEPEPTPEPEPEPVEEENTSGITLDVLTTKTREFVQGNVKNRKLLKGFLDEKGAPKVSELAPADYAEALTFMETNSQ